MDCDTQKRFRNIIANKLSTLSMKCSGIEVEKALNSVTPLPFTSLRMLHLWEEERDLAIKEWKGLPEPEQFVACKGGALFTAPISNASPTSLTFSASTKTRLPL